MSRTPKQPRPSAKLPREFEHAMQGLAYWLGYQHVRNGGGTLPHEGAIVQELASPLTLGLGAHGDHVVRREIPVDEVNGKAKRRRAGGDRVCGGVRERRSARAFAVASRGQGGVRLKLDENIAVSAKARLAALGFDVDTALDEGLGGLTDDEVWSASQKESRFLVTQDLDFSDVRRFQPGHHEGILLVRLPDHEQWRIGDFLVAWF